MEVYGSTRYASLLALATLFSLLLGATRCTAAKAHPAVEATTDFIKTSCTNTTDPPFCFASLSPYASTIQASPTQLVRVSISVSLTSARSASDMVTKLSKPPVVPAVSDCTLIMGDAVVQLQRSLDSMGRFRFGINGAGAQMNDVQTWVSTAATDEKSCMDGLASSTMDGATKSRVTGQLNKAVKLSFNALAFINSLASQVFDKKKP